MVLHSENLSTVSAAWSTGNPCQELSQAGGESVPKRVVLPVCLSAPSISQMEKLRMRNITHVASMATQQKSIRQLRSWCAIMKHPTCHSKAFL